ncbi:hypothetical protein FQN57_006957 [Myotisia sp. PD_48]|nr:hypothetical protein FQN57_006957 [Myotisia sp. PD_48]
MAVIHRHCSQLLFGDHCLYTATLLYRPHLNQSQVRHSCQQSRPMELPTLPVAPKEFVPYFHDQLKTGKTAAQVLEPFKKYESKLREVYAQEPHHEAVSDPYTNLVPLFAGHEQLLTTHARQLNDETVEEKEKYIFPLQDQFRRPHGSPAVVQSLSEFKRNFKFFSESSLGELDWNNVVAAGSSVITPLLPVPEKFNTSAQALRHYYHQKLAPASDVDLFLYGLNEEEAIEKIKQIEKCVKSSICEDTSSIRTKNTITIVSKYPIRHVQIVLRLYKNVSEILTGFDVDCACVAYNGSQVWASPRAIASAVTQVNAIDLTRRSPSYENRLAKYSRRGFEVHWPDLDRSQIDPSIYERAFSRVVGLARLLVMERLPTQNDRDAYLQRRGRERGTVTRIMTRRIGSRNLKAKDPEDIPEWADDEQVSDYHTFTIPYGPKHNAKTIERLLFKKDVLLNARWNESKDRQVKLHRHPAFFGDLDDIIKDCCGFCPKPETSEEKEVAEADAKRYITGAIEFMKDNPGRQAIGSFNPITEDDWTLMAYVTDTSKLCHAIVGGDIAYVKEWCNTEGVDINARDHTGRTPLHLATICGQVEIATFLIEQGARIVARLRGGFTALHIAAYSGHLEILKALLKKSEDNERKLEEESAAAAKASENVTDSKGTEEVEDDLSVISEAKDSDHDVLDATTDASFVRVSTPKASPEKEKVLDENDSNQPDIFTIDVLGWDLPVSPLHLAIMHGHLHIIDELVSTYGADITLPVAVSSQEHESPPAVLSTALSLALPAQKSLAVTKLLLQLGASSAQANTDYFTVLHMIVASGSPELLDQLFDLDRPAAMSAINHPAVDGSYYRASMLFPLETAIMLRDSDFVKKLLQHGAEASVEPKSYQHLVTQRLRRQGISRHSDVRIICPSPLFIAAAYGKADMIQLLLDAGVDPDEPFDSGREKHSYSRSSPMGSNLLSAIVAHFDWLRPDFSGMGVNSGYLDTVPEGSYRHWMASANFEVLKASVEGVKSSIFASRKQDLTGDGSSLSDDEAESKIKTLIQQFESVKDKIQIQDDKELNPHLELESTLSILPGIAPQLSGSSMQDTISEAYTNLFEAAWNNDVEVFKKYTLGPWGETKHTPLLVTQRDTRGFSPFDIAIIRGHLHLASLIMSIANMHYKPNQDVKRRYRIVQNNYYSDCDYSDTESDCSYGGEVYTIESEIVDESTVLDVREIDKTASTLVHPFSLLKENAQYWEALDDSAARRQELIGQINTDWLTRQRNTQEIQRTIVKNFISNTPYELQNKWSPLQYAIEKGDTQLANYILSFVAKYPEMAFTHMDGERKSFVKHNDFSRALKLGRIDILSSMVEKAAAGMSLKPPKTKDTTEDSKEYRGLTVHGKKKAEWALKESSYDSNRYNYGDYNVTPKADTPLLLALRLGTLESVKWALSEKPLELYLKFMSTYKDAEFLKPLLAVEGGIEKHVASYLESYENLALHAAVLAQPSKEDDGVERVRLVLERFPHLLDSQAFLGLSPLHLALSRRSVPVAKFLIDSGANQALRDSRGRNILHHILRPHSGDPITSCETLESMLKLIDPQLAGSALATDRAKGPWTDQTSLEYSTPLNYWLTGNNVVADNPEVLREILKFTGGAELKIMDARGEYPIHTAINDGHISLVKVLVEYNPGSLQWENATGWTAMECLNRSYERTCILQGENLRNFIRTIPSLEYRRVFGFTDHKMIDRQLVSAWQDMNSYLEALPSGTTTERRLVSVLDAHELVRRLGAEQELAMEKAQEKEQEDSPRPYWQTLDSVLSGCDPGLDITKHFKSSFNHEPKIQTIAYPSTTTAKSISEAWPIFPADMNSIPEG